MSRAVTGSSMFTKHQAQTVEPSPPMDFRAPGDDAWYTVRLRLEEDKLRIMYCNFSAVFDDVHSVESFADFESIDKFRRRFRPTSSQLQDRNCDVVVKGMIVCASYLFAEDDLRFYDAIVESVNPSIHSLQEGQCRCKFELLWQHGPLYGTKTIVSIEHLCLVTSQDKDFNMILKDFLDTAKRELLYKNSQKSKPSSCVLNSTQNSVPENTRHGFSQVTVSSCTSSATVHKSKKPQQVLCSFMDMRALGVEHTSMPTVGGRSSNEIIGDNLEQDVDMGGQLVQNYENFKKERPFHFCRIDNLEKDSSPFDLMHFVQEHLEIPCSAFVCPSLSHEFYTRGFILVEGSYQAQKLMDFLLNGEFFIVSLSGRPWVIDDTCCGIAKGVMPYEVGPTNAREELPSQIKLVHKGTDEYEKIKKLHTLHEKYLEHVNFDLLGRLLADEKTLLKQME